MCRVLSGGVGPRYDEITVSYIRVSAHEQVRYSRTKAAIIKCLVGTIEEPETSASTALMHVPHDHPARKHGAAAECEEQKDHVFVARHSGYDLHRPPRIFSQDERLGFCSIRNHFERVVASAGKRIGRLRWRPLSFRTLETTACRSPQRTPRNMRMRRSRGSDPRLLVQRWAGLPDRSFGERPRAPRKAPGPMARRMDSKPPALLSQARAVRSASVAGLRSDPVRRAHICKSHLYVRQP